eukprot:2525371-Prymnesium_polylepis.1
MTPGHAGRTLGRTPPSRWARPCIRSSVLGLGPAMADAPPLGPISRPPGFLPTPCGAGPAPGGHSPREAGSAERPPAPPGGHSPASHAGDARLAVLNPGRDTCFVTGCSA